MSTASPPPASRNGAKNQVQLGKMGLAQQGHLSLPCHGSPKKSSERGESPTAARVGSNPPLKAGRSVKS